MNSRLPFSFLAIALLSGCTPAIKPWERGILAKPHMALQTSPAEAALRHHVQASKEASLGGHTGGGGGCGCN
ncbi:DUF4266 domain-containing protein [Methylomonas sp. MgM2]